MQNAVKIFLEISVYSSIMIIAALGIKALLFGKLNLKIISFLWLIVLLRLILPVTFESPVHIGLFDRLPTNESSSMTAAEDNSIIVGAENDSPENVAPSNFKTAEMDMLSVKTKLIETTIIEKIKNIALRTDAWNLIIYLWIISTAIILSKKIYRIVVFSRKIRKTKTIDSKLKIKLEHAKRIIKIKTDIRIAELRYVDIPLICGLLKPIILLPVGLKDSINDNKLLLIILHELCHIKRKDILVNYIWLAATTLHWFNPLVKVAYKNYLDNVEEACDEMVLTHLDKKYKFEYTQSLLDVIRLTKNRIELPLSVSFCRDNSTIRKRVMKMMKPQKKSKTLGLITLLISCVMIFACFTTACQSAEATKNISQPIETETPITSNEEPSTADGAQDPPEPSDGVHDGIWAIEQLNLSQIGSIDLVKTENYFGDKIFYYNCNEGAESASYRMLESDHSLVAFENKAVDMTLAIELSDDEFKAIAVDYAKKVWGYENIEITSCEASSLGPKGDFYYCGVDGVISETGRTFTIDLNGQGGLRGLSSYPTEVDMEKGVSIEEARQIALELLREQAHITNENNLTLISETLSTDHSPMYIFTYEYRSDNPTSQEFDYDCEVKVIAATGKTMGAGIKPITSNIEVYSIEEAEQMAKEYIVKEEGLDDISKLVTTEKWPRTDEEGIIYTFMFEYNSEYAYSLMMVATGEFWDIAGGKIDR